MAARASTAESRLTCQLSRTNAATSSANAKITASRGPTRPVTRGRPCVRGINRSMSRSITMFMAFAPPAASAPPNSVVTMRRTGGTPSWARTMVGSVVMRSSSTMRGLVRATKPPTRLRGVRRLP